MRFGKKKEVISDKFFPIPNSNQFVNLVLPTSSGSFGYNSEWLAIEKQNETAPIGSLLMAIGVLNEPSWGDYVKKMVHGAEIHIAEKMQLKESQEFLESLAKSVELGGALAFLEAQDLVTPVGKLHPSVWNAFVFHAFEDEENYATNVQSQARFCALLVGHGLIWENFKSPHEAVQTITSIKY